MGEVKGFSKLERTCSGCPDQWEGKTDDGRHFYAHYRHDRLTWGYGKSKDEAIDASFMEGIIIRGFEMSTETMLERVKEHERQHVQG